MRNTIESRLGSMRLLLPMLAHDPVLELHVLPSFYQVAGFVQWQQYGGGGSMDEETGLPEVPEDPNAGKTPEEIAADVNCMAHGICGVFMR